MLNIVRADTSVFELVIWLIVTLVWIVAQSLARARKNRELSSPSAPPPPVRPTSADQPEDIEEFFKLLRKQFEAGAAKPAAPPPPPPPLTIASQPSPPPPSPITMEAKPRPQPPRPRLRPKPPPTPPLGKVPPLEQETMVAHDLPTTPSVHVGPQVSFESVRRDILSLKVGFSSRGLRLPDVRITSKFHRRAAPSIQRLFHGRDGLKKAVIARHVLGAPRSLRPWLYPED